LAASFEQTFAGMPPPATPNVADIGDEFKQNFDPLEASGRP
jgi:hypothetical protein